MKVVDAKIARGGSITPSPRMRLSLVHSVGLVVCHLAGWDDIDLGPSTVHLVQMGIWLNRLGR